MTQENDGTAISVGLLKVSGFIATGTSIMHISRKSGSALIYMPAKLLQTTNLELGRDQMHNILETLCSIAVHICWVSLVIFLPLH